MVTQAGTVVFERQFRMNLEVEYVHRAFPEIFRSAGECEASARAQLERASLVCYRTTRWTLMRCATLEQ